MIVVPPTELVLSYPDNRTAVDPSQQVNVTCTARHSKPPAKLRWFKGYTELTDTAYLHVDEPDEQGRTRTSNLFEIGFRAISLSSKKSLSLFKNKIVGSIIQL